MAFCRSLYCRLNRLLIDQRYDNIIINNVPLSIHSDNNAKEVLLRIGTADSIAIVELPFSDHRVQHVQKVLGLNDGGELNETLFATFTKIVFQVLYQCVDLTDSIRTGVVNGDIDDQSSISWNHSNKTLNISFKASSLYNDQKDIDTSGSGGNRLKQHHGVDVILAMPSPRKLVRILPLMTSIGVDNIFLVRCINTYPTTI